MRTTPRDLTAKQQRVLDYLTRYLHKNGIPPTRKEISKHFGFKSQTAAQGHLMLIAKKGYIKLMNGGISRGIQIL